MAVIVGRGRLIAGVDQGNYRLGYRNPLTGELEGADIDIGDDTLQVTIPENTEERLERGARQVGGAVGEALEETGEAIEEAGTRVQEEVREGEAEEEPDTTAM